MIHSAIIMAGGKGTRMGFLTNRNPKCLLKVGGFTILSHLYTQLRVLKIKKIVVATGYLHKKIKKYCKQKLYEDSDNILNILGKKIFSNNYPKITLSSSSLSHSTSQRLLAAKKKIQDDNFIYLYGDTLLKPNFFLLLNNFYKNNFLGVITISNPISNFGIITTKKKLVTEFEEKKKIKNIWVNSGWMILNKKIFSYLSNRLCNFESYLFKILVKQKKLGYVKNKGLYIPLDKVDDLELASKVFKKNIKSWF
jgi:glucose-1-phosphate cytidylyltransferase